MDEKFKFSIITAFYNCDKYLDESINSIINQDIGFEDNVQLILVDDGSTDNSKEICLRYQEIYPNNIIVLSQENKGVSSARNLGLEYINGFYVNFLDGDDLLTENTLTEVENFFLKYDDIDLVTIPLKFFGKIEGGHYLNYKFTKGPIIDVNTDFESILLSSSSSFIKSDILANYKFNVNLINFEDAVFVNEIILNKMKYGVLESVQYLYRQRFDKSSATDNAFISKKVFTEKIKYSYKHLINFSLKKYGIVPKYIQFLLINDIRWMVKYRQFDKVFDNNYEVTEFKDALKEVLSYIDDEIILNHRNLNQETKSFLIYFKRSNLEIVPIQNTKKVFFKSNGLVINRIHTHKLFLDIVEIDGNSLNISGYMSSFCDIDSLKLIATVKTPQDKYAQFKAKYIDYSTSERQNKRHLDIDWVFYYNFDLKIPLIENENYKITFKLIYEENDNKVEMNLPIDFKNYCNLSQISNYFVNGKRLLFFKDNEFHLINYSSKFRFKLELNIIFNLLKSLNFYHVFIRILYFIYSFYYKNNKIWLFMDKLDSAGDNGEILFDYAVNQEDNIKKYYILNETSNDFKRLSEFNVIKANTLKHKLLYLLSEKLISSHPDNDIVNPFYYLNDEGVTPNKFISGLSQSKVYFLQNCATKGNSSTWLHKYDCNLKLITTISDLESNSFKENGYNYDEEIIQALGFPRFDNLDNNHVKKQIIIIPSLNQEINSEESFINSSYYKTWNNLCNNDKFIGSAKNNGYQIIFKPDSNILKYVDLFNFSEDILIIDDFELHKVICESSLLITDFSPVFFDFAYLKKPIIYYHYDDYNFDSQNGYFNYKSMGFGEIISNENSLCDKIIFYMDNECKLEEKYLKRINNFFKFIDKNNCERVYNWIKND